MRFQEFSGHAQGWEFGDEGYRFPSPEQTDRRAHRAHPYTRYPEREAFPEYPVQPYYPQPAYGYQYPPLHHQIPENGRALNPITEYYVWSHSAGQLYKVDEHGTVLSGPRISGRTGQAVDPTDEELIVFHPCSYHKIYRDSLEIIPTSTKSLNDWVRGQACLKSCRFRFEGKRPATIRNHFISCKLRLELPTDPIRRVCELSHNAHKRFKRSVSTEQEESSPAENEFRAGQDSIPPTPITPIAPSLPSLPPSSLNTPIQTSAPVAWPQGQGGMHHSHMGVGHGHHHSMPHIPMGMPHQQHSHGHSHSMAPHAMTGMYGNSPPLGGMMMPPVQISSNTSSVRGSSEDDSDGCRSRSSTSSSITTLSVHK